VVNGTSSSTQTSQFLLPGGTSALVVHTVRSVRPSLAAIAAVLALAVAGAVVAGSQGIAIPMPLAQLAAAALAVAFATPHDPAANLMAAMPTGTTRRLAYRSSVLASAAITGWLLGGWTIDTVVAGTPAGSLFAAGVPELTALAAVAVAGGRWWGPWGACTPLALVAAGNLVEGTSALAEVVGLWSTQPWPTLAAGLIAIACHLVRHS
jgi:hypothetical protein